MTGHISRSDFITALIAGARASTGGAADAQYIANREAVGTYFAITQGLTDAEAAKSVEVGVNSSIVSVTAANQHTDLLAATVATPAGSELVVQLVGVAL